MQGFDLRRQRGELAGYSLQFRLLRRGAVSEQHQGRRVLLLRRLDIPLRRLDIPQRRVDDGVRLRWRSRLGRRRCGGNASGSRRGRRRALEPRQGDAIEFRERQAIEFRQRDRIEQGEAIGIGEEVRGGRANDGQRRQRHHGHRHAARRPLQHRLGLIVLRCFVQRLGHLRSQRPSGCNAPTIKSAKQKAVAWTIPATTRAR